MGDSNSWMNLSTCQHTCPLDVEGKGRVCNLDEEVGGDLEVREALDEEGSVVVAPGEEAQRHQRHRLVRPRLQRPVSWSRLTGTAERKKGQGLRESSCEEGGTMRRTLYMPLNWATSSGLERERSPLRRPWNSVAVSRIPDRLFTISVAKSCQV